MLKLVPNSKPQLSKEDCIDLAKLAKCYDDIFLLGRRGYYRDTMGEKGKNDINIYDDAIFLVSPTAFLSFNANTDPSVLRNQVAILQKGIYQYKIGTHNISKAKSRQYKALVQAGPVVLKRWTENKLGYSIFTGYFGINIHKGSITTTSSLGCQTIHPSQWEQFLVNVIAEMKKHKVKTISYVLTEYANI